MDPLSTAASIVSILQLSSKVIGFIRSASGAKKERRFLREELRACEHILQHLYDEAADSEEGHGWSPTIKALEAPGGPLCQFKTALEEVEKRLKPQEGVREAMASLKWPFDKAEIKEIFVTIKREKSLFKLALANKSRKLLENIASTSREHNKQLTQLVHTMEMSSVDSEAKLSNLQGDFARVYNSQTGLHDELNSLTRRFDGYDRTEERLNALEWLSPDDYSTKQSTLLSRKQAGTGEWLLNSPEFRNWLELGKDTLLCLGIPGTGKTFLTSIVVEKLINQFWCDKDTCVAYIYCEFGRQDEQDPRKVFASLLRQLVQGQSPLPQCVESLYIKYQSGQKQATYEDIISALYRAAKLYSRILIVIDALDEFGISSGDRGDLLSTLLTFQAECGTGLLVTSRHIPDVSEAFRNVQKLEILASKHDLRKFLDGKMSRLPRFVQRSPDLQEEIKASITEAADGMFLLAKFQSDSLQRQVSVKGVRAILANLPSGLNAYDRAYLDAMERIESQAPEQAELAKRVISWIVKATRRLKATELRDALAVEYGKTALDSDNLSDIDDMVSFCAGLVIVDEKSDIVSLVHYSAQEYFARTWNECFPYIETEITTICCTYLLFQAFLSGPCKTDLEYEQRLRTNPFFDYAAKNWGYHASNANAPCQQVNDFLQSRSHIQASSQALFRKRKRIAAGIGYRAGFPANFGGLHQAAYFGVSYAVKVLLNNEVGIEKDSHGRTPLYYAVSNDHSGVVELLLETESVDPNKPDDDGMAALGWAAMSGSTAVLGVLLATGKVQINSRDKYGRTPLALAAANSHTAIVQKLLATEGVDANLKTIVSWDPRLANPNEDGLFFPGGIPASRTPLTWASEAGSQPIVENLLLFGQEFVDLPDELGMRPLSYAAQGGHLAIVKLLIRTNKTDPDSTTYTGNYLNRGRTPLSFAAEHGFISVVEELLHTGQVNPDSQLFGPYLPGRTPLSFAAEGGHTAVVKLLLQTGKVNIDSLSTGNYSSTWAPVFWVHPASGEERESANAFGGPVGRTPLSWAAEAGKEVVAQLLLAEGANVNSIDINGWTPLSWAAYEGSNAVVELLLSASGTEVDFGRPGYRGDGRTSLSIAAERGHCDIVRMLLSKGAQRDFQDNQGRTPLLWAAKSGHADVTRELLKNNAAVDLADENGRTPLSHAITEDNETVVELLLCEGADLESRDSRGRTSLSHASRGSLKAVEVLLKGGVMIDSKDDNGRTPLSHCAASGYGYDTLVQLLISRHAEIDSKDNNNRTPLSHAVTGWSSESCIKLLLSQKADVHWKDNEGQSAVSRAIEQGCDSITQLLTEAEAGDGFKH